MCFDKPVSNTSAKSLPTKDKAEEDDSERQPFQDALGIMKIPHPLPHKMRLTMPTPRLYPATFGLKFPPRVDDNLRDNLSPFNPTLPRIDFWELKAQYTIGLYRDVEEVNKITFSRNEQGTLRMRLEWWRRSSSMIPKERHLYPWQIIGEGNSSLVREGDEILCSSH
ncbi:hypothetical protein B0H34DRAFT_137104 [Crassisporium funariophilum]|nr:hypothetical protein B0H34DRAFT_137104 [Crassisporium funariophilum]